MTKLDVSSAIRDRWFINDKNILDSKSKADGYFVFKFCYDPEIGEFLCDIWPSNHKDIIEIYGKKKFNDYVRGIYFKENKTVYLRQNENEKLLFQTREFLREHGVPCGIRIIWGKEVAQELASLLRGL